MKALVRQSSTQKSLTWCGPRLLSVRRWKAVCRAMERTRGLYYASGRQEYICSEEYFDSKESPTVFCSHLDESMELLREALDALGVKTPPFKRSAFGVFTTVFRIEAERLEVPDEEALQNAAGLPCVNIPVLIFH